MSTPADIEDKDAVKLASAAYAQSLRIPPSSKLQLQAAESMTESAMLRLKEIEVTIDTSGSEVDSIANELVPQLQKHTEQLTNVFALIDKMAEHIENVKTSVNKMEARLEAAEAANAGQVAIIGHTCFGY
ncbi:hypothetical protein GUITHDRAFT_109159 [Guillardia theta CCMP2712]|uniref:BLOC-1-related complex subunit 7 n=1 Tax=Guillardia theta (strain CCMP2712) TaxID=905079 RepID=L1JAJ2_GUITC|nr:hypothetical protein GUITHDRAFT_109159 [Guillardia theta CCMP2712]EKX45115.1 hypothetical protein GUITHDRAFT_109159 [Guillardia theta CCMP2712]|eukprot:XP_005832095.1 hypothetical protein GUITHDRAFT_109159 [Guillardia theta CCMP2712]